jgi:CelD/BcsL family acetyltransferase involved in cellulose biosynthesis
LLKLHQVSLSQAPWQEMAAFQDRLVFQSREWLQFLMDSKEVRPVLAECLLEGTRVGWFTGLTFERYGMRILGSPLPGWTTPYMGFNLRDGVDRADALEALGRFAFDDLRCIHFEIVDRFLTAEDGRRAGCEVGRGPSFESDLTLSEDALFASMHSSYRRCIRKSQKSPLSIEEVSEDDGFAEEYHRQLMEVFEKHHTTPSYGVERVRRLIARLSPAGGLLLLRARDGEGRSIATGIYPYGPHMGQFWGNASYKFGLHLRPNQALHWHAMRRLKALGVERFDWGGGGTYKLRFGATPIDVPRLSRSRNRAVTQLREAARFTVKRMQRARYWAGQVVRGRGDAGESAGASIEA